MVESIDRHAGEDTKSGALGLLRDIDTVRADGDNVVFELESGDAEMARDRMHQHLQRVLDLVLRD